MKSVRRFFWWCSGSNIQILEKHPTEHNKYFGIGATVFFTALFAALSGGYALYFIFSGSAFAEVYAVVFGLIWGLAIFNLDRYIVSSIEKSGSVGQQWLQAAPRLLLAWLIALIIARPLELKIFDKEIRAVLAENYLSAYKNKIDTLNATFEKKYVIELNRLAQSKAEADSLDKEISQLRYELNLEFFGEKTNQTSGVQGFGPFAKRKEAVIVDKENRVRSLRQTAAEMDSFINYRKDLDGLNDLTMLTDNQLNELVNIAGFADRNSALSQIALPTDGKGATSTSWAIWFITMLFIAFECLPVFVKLLSSRGPYDVEVYTHEKLKMLEMEDDLEVKIKIKQANKEHYVNSQIEKDKSYIDTKTRAEVELTDEAIDHWKNKESGNIKENITDYIRLK